MRQYPGGGRSLRFYFIAPAEVPFMHRGFIKIWRKIEDSFLGNDLRLTGFVVWLIKNANWKDRETVFNKQKLVIKRGQLIIGTLELSKKFKIGRQIIRTMLDQLTNLDFLTIKPTNKFSILTICNYDKYQDVNYESNQQLNQRLTNGQPTANQRLTTSKEGKKEKKVNKPSLITLENLPKELATQDFLKTWFEWEAYRKEAKKPLTQISIKKQLSKLSVIGEKRAITAINHSIANSYTGIYEGSNKIQTPEEQMALSKKRALM